MKYPSFRDIFRPIRDGFRHLFSPHHRPDEEEEPAKMMRKAELAMKGFFYLETFEELELWNSDQTDPLQRASIPILCRSTSEPTEARKLAKVLLCHDYAGGYAYYESCGMVGVEEEQYACEYLQHVDVFTYFSHRLVTVPPPTWTNALHRNGVKVLGTLIIEPQMSGMESLLERRLISESNSNSNIVNSRLRYPMAIKLVQMARFFGFDGWLVNIEKPFSKAVWNVELLLGFLTELREELGPQGQVVWYDALTISNKVSYQNGVTHSNLSFLEACGSLLTNYAWEPSRVQNAVTLAIQRGLDPKSIYFGVDVWAQNQPRDFVHPRVTYPEADGGGTNTGVAVSKCADIGVSSGIFGPAWSFEHFDGDNRKLVDRAIWEGTSGPDQLICNCWGGKAGAANPHRTVDPEAAVSNKANESPSGSDSFFWTDFARPFERHHENLKHIYAGLPIHAQLGAQSILPRNWQKKKEIREGKLWLELKNDPGHAVVGISPTEACHDNQPLYASMDLFKLNISIHPTNALKLRIEASSFGAPNIEAGIYLKDSQGGLSKHKIVSDGDEMEPILLPNPDQLPDFRIVELGVYFRFPGWFSIDEAFALLTLRQISILPSVEERPCNIKDIIAEVRGEGKLRHVRLVWNLTDSSLEKQGGCPCSPITGPFSHFEIQVDGLDLGRVYALEMILPTILTERWRNGKGINVRISGVRFGGLISDSEVSLREADLDWEIVQRV